MLLNEVKVGFRPAVEDAKAEEAEEAQEDLIEEGVAAEDANE